MWLMHKLFQPKQNHNLYKTIQEDIYPANEGNIYSGTKSTAVRSGMVFPVFLSAPIRKNAGLRQLTGGFTPGYVESTVRPDVEVNRRV